MVKRLFYVPMNPAATPMPTKVCTSSAVTPNVVVDEQDVKVLVSSLTPLPQNSENKAKKTANIGAFIFGQCCEKKDVYSVLR